MFGHWPEKLLSALLLLGAFLPVAFRPQSLLYYLLLVLAGVLLAFGVWVGVIRIACKIHDLRVKRNGSG